jgi:hypothetical protein
MSRSHGNEIVTVLIERLKWIDISFQFEVIEPFVYFLHFGFVCFVTTSECIGIRCLTFVNNTTGQQRTFLSHLYERVHLVGFFSPFYGKHPVVYILVNGISMSILSLILKLLTNIDHNVIAF